MNGKMKDLTTRSITGIVLTAVVFGATLWSRWSFGVLLLAVQLGCQREFYKMARRDGIRPQWGFGLIIGSIFYMMNFAAMTLMLNGDGVVLFILGIMLLYLLLVIPMMFIIELSRTHDNPIANIGTTFLGVLYVALPMSLLLYIPALAGRHHEWDAWAMLFYILLIWSNDVCAYLVGVSIGRHKMFERISPKKSWEGFVGGICGALGMGFLAAHFMGGRLQIWLGLALVAAVTGVLGDLVESMFKRSVGVKDSGRIMPGHGGWLDRFDALILSAPFAIVYLLLVRYLTDSIN